MVPAGGKLGEEVEVRFLGDPAGEIKQKVKLPAAMPKDGKFGVFCQDAGGISPSGLPFRLSRPSANVVEVEPNDAAAQATAGDAARARSTASSRSRATSTTSVRGEEGAGVRRPLLRPPARLAARPGDVHGLIGGGAIVGNDDAVGPDSYFRVTDPAGRRVLCSASPTT